MGFDQVDPSTLLIFDWEFASYGPSQYDIAYATVFSDFEFSELQEQKDVWKALATSVICHWYLQEAAFSPKQAIFWYEELAKAVQKIT